MWEYFSTQNVETQKKNPLISSIDIYKFEKKSQNHL